MSNYIIKIPNGMKSWEADNWRTVDSALKNINATKQTTTAITSISSHSAVTIPLNSGLVLDGQAISMGIPSACTGTTPNSISIATHSHTITGLEPALGNPGVTGYVLSSTTAGIRSWVANGAGAGEPALGNPGADGYVLSSTMAGVRSWVANGAGEPALGNPGADGYVLSSTTAGVRSWVAQTGGGFTTNSKMSMSADQTISDLTWTKLNFNTVIIDADSECSTINNTWTCTTAGTYIIVATSVWDPSGTGVRSIAISENGSAPGYGSWFVNTPNAGAAYTTRNVIMAHIICTAGQSLSVWGYHNNGTTLDIDYRGCYFSVFRIS